MPGEPSTPDALRLGRVGRLRGRIRDRLEGSDRYPWAVTAIVLFAMSMVTISITILAANIAAIAEDLGSDKTILNWVITGPILATAIMGTTAGKLGDLHGHRRVFLVGLSGAAVFSFGCALAWDAGSLISFRIIAATLGAVSGPSSLAMINLLFPAEQRARALGYWSMVEAAGPVMGLIVGGLVIDSLGWRAIFWAQAPLLALGAAVAWLMVPDTPRRAGARFDVAGQVLLGSALLGILVPLNQANRWGWTSVWVVAPVVAAMPLLVAFVRLERRRGEHALLPLGYFSQRNFVSPVASRVFTNFAYMGGFIIIPQLMRDVRGFSDSATTLMMIPRPLAFALAGAVAGILVSRFGERACSVWGGAGVTASMLVLAAISTDPAVGWVIVALVLSGFGLGAAAPALLSTIANSVADHDLGVAGAVHQVATSVAVAFGTTIMVTVQVSGADRTDPGRSYSHAFLVGACVCLLGVVAAAFVRNQERGSSSEEELLSVEVREAALGLEA